MLEEFLAHMRARGWAIQMNEVPGPGLPEAVRKRYPSLPETWLEFTGAVKSLVSGCEQTWFLCAGDYAPQKDGAFRWNEWELLSLEAAGDDPAQRRETVRFWDEHLPVLLSVKGGYSYYAISMRDGSVVHGFEP